MIFNSRLVLASAMLAHEALAFNAHRAAHHQVHRQAIQKKDGLFLHTETVVVTEVVYQTVYDDEDEPTPTPAAFFKGAAPVPTTTSTSSSSSSSSSSSTSTSTSSPAEVPAPPPPSAAPAPSPTPVVAAPAPEVKPPVVEEVKPPVVAAVPEPTLVVAAQPAPSPAAPAPAPAPVVETPAVASAPVSVAPVSSGGKRGLAFNNGNFLAPFVGTKAASWCYSWGQTRDSKIPAGMAFTPMMWCPRPDHESTWAKNAEKAISEGAKEFLSFNEPDIPSQCNLDPGTTAGHHKRLMNPYAGRVRISTPSVSNSNLAGQGLQWLKSFIQACNGACSFDFCAIHWYSPPNVENFLKDMKTAHDICGKNIWITEFATVEASADQSEDFIRKVAHELDTNPEYSFVERYSWFMADVGADAHKLLSSSTSLNRFGQAYATA